MIGITTDMGFPIDEGTEVNVNCGDGFLNTGSATVTCNRRFYDGFQFTELPTCLSTGNGILKL